MVDAASPSSPMRSSSALRPVSSASSPPMYRSSRPVRESPPRANASTSSTARSAAAMPSSGSASARSFPTAPPRPMVLRNPPIATPRRTSPAPTAPSPTAPASALTSGDSARNCRTRPPMNRSMRLSITGLTPIRKSRNPTVASSRSGINWATARNASDRIPSATSAIASFASSAESRSGPLNAYPSTRARAAVSRIASPPPLMSDAMPCAARPSTTCPSASRSDSDSTPASPSRMSGRMSPNSRRRPSLSVADTPSRANASDASALPRCACNCAAASDFAARSSPPAPTPARSNATPNA